MGNPDLIVSSLISAHADESEGCTSILYSGVFYEDEFLRSVRPKTPVMIRLSEQRSSGELVARLASLLDDDLVVLIWDEPPEQPHYEVVRDVLKDRKFELTIGEGGAARVVSVDLPELVMLSVFPPYEPLPRGIFEACPVRIIIGRHDIDLVDDDFYGTAAVEKDHGSTGDEVRGDEDMPSPIRYLAVENSIVRYAIAYSIFKIENKEFVLGAYYGYVGGGENDGGYFLIDNASSVQKHFDYSEVDEMGESQPELVNNFEYLMRCIWSLIENDDEELHLTEEGQAIYSPDEDGVWMDEEFDGDMLEEVSEMWHISLRFTA